jgi:hypothetical protein
MSPNRSSIIVPALLRSLRPFELTAASNLFCSHDMSGRIESTSSRRSGTLISYGFKSVWLIVNHALSIWLRPIPRGGKGPAALF